MLDRNNPYSSIPQLEKKIKELERAIESGESLDEFGDVIQALKNALNKKQNTLTAGENITITNNVISAIGGGGGSVSDAHIRQIIEAYDYITKSEAQCGYQPLPEDEDIDETELQTLLDFIFD